MRPRLLLTVFSLACATLPVHAADFVVNVTADDSTSYYEYFSEGFARIDLRDPPPNEFRQRIHNINDPSMSYGAIDVFPNDEAMRFGSITYDESSLIGGTGTANVTGLTIDILQDPFDTAYKNYDRFPGTTEVTYFLGTVDVVNGSVTSFDLTIDVSLHFPSIYGATMEGVYDGQLVLQRDMFSVDIEGDPFLDIIFNPAGENVHFGWFGTGSINGVDYAVPGDLDGDLFVGQDDLNLVLGSWGQFVSAGSSSDPSHDGFVGQDDLNIILGAWGKGSTPIATQAAVVPEVSTIFLVPIPVAAWVLARHRRRKAG